MDERPALSKLMAVEELKLVRNGNQIRQDDMVMHCLVLIALRHQGSRNECQASKLTAPNRGLGLCPRQLTSARGQGQGAMSSPPVCPLCKAIWHRSWTGTSTAGRCQATALVLPALKSRSAVQTKPESEQDMQHTGRVLLQQAAVSVCTPYVPRGPSRAWLGTLASPSSQID